MVLEKKKLDEQHLVVKCLLLCQVTAISLHSLIDCGDSVFAFVDENFACQHNIFFFPLKIPSCLEEIDARLIESGNIMQTTQIICNIGNHLKTYQ